MDAPKHFAEMINSLQRCGLSLPEISRQSGVGYGTVWRGATGQLRQPSYRCVVRLQNLAEKIGPPPTGMVRR